jgi:hypothetical protein
MSKDDPACENCERRINYLMNIEYGPECRQDQCYAASCFLPRSFSRQLGSVPQWSQADLMLGFAR